MEVIVGVNPDYKDWKVVDADTNEDLSQFCWAADDEAGLYVLFDNDGKAVLASTDEHGEKYIQSYTYEGHIKLVKV